MDTLIYQGSSSSEFEVVDSPIQIAKRVQGNLVRTQIIITNTGEGTVTINKGIAPPINGRGIIISPNFTYIEATDGGYTCFQGSISAIRDSEYDTNTLSVVESFETKRDNIIYGDL